MIFHRGSQWCVFCYSLLTISSARASPYVRVGLRTAFAPGPYLVELLETATAENETAYFPLLDQIASGYFAKCTTDVDLYEKFFKVLLDDEFFDSQATLSRFDFALSLRSAAPRIEAHYQYYSSTVKTNGMVPKNGDWAILDGKEYSSIALNAILKDGGPILNQPKLPFDRTLGRGGDVILYADPTSETFSKLHQTLSTAARASKLRYRLRYRRRTTDESRLLPVSGFGVELALKKTDYIVFDDRDASLNQSFHLGPASLATSGQEHPTSDIQPLSASQIQYLGLKTATMVLESEDPLKRLITLIQDFPKLSASVASAGVSKDFALEYNQNKGRLGLAGYNCLWINGLQLTERQVEPFALVKLLRRESALLSGLKALGLKATQAIALLGHEAVAEARDGGKPLRFDWTDRQEQEKAIVWLNDLETDNLYKAYPRSPRALLQRVYPGQIPPVGLNIFNVVIAADLSKEEYLELGAQVASIISRGIPIRFGLVPLAEPGLSMARAKILYHLFDHYEASARLSYLLTLGKKPLKNVEEQLFENITLSHQSHTSNHTNLCFADVIEDSKSDTRTRLAQRWVERLGVKTSPRPIFINGVAVPFKKDWFQVISLRIREDLQTVQQHLLEIDEELDSWDPNFFVQGAMSKRSIYIAVDTEKTSRVLNVDSMYKEHAMLFDTIPILDSLPETSKETWAVVTVVADMTTSAGENLVLAALEFKRRNPGVRLEFLHTAGRLTTSGTLEVMTTLKASSCTLAKIDSVEGLRNLLARKQEFAHVTLTTASLNSLFSTTFDTGMSTIIFNGRCIGPLPSSSVFTAEDYQQLLEVEQKLRIIPVYKAFKDLGLSNKLTNAVDLAKASSLLANSGPDDMTEDIDTQPSGRSSIYQSWNFTHTTVELGDAEAASVHVWGIMDPVSEKAQKWASIVQALSRLESVHVKLTLHPRNLLEDLPIKRFYRYVLQSKPSFDAAGNMHNNIASFGDLPSKTLMTLGLDVPSAWLVNPNQSIHDLDNIKTDALESDVEAVYNLEHLLIEGHSRESNGAPPRGAQLGLTTAKHQLLTDTIVMSNLGYFQFKANPGLFHIQAKEGRTAEIYTIESVGSRGWGPTPDDGGTELALLDFEGTTLFPRLQRRRGMENEDVIGAEPVTNDRSLLSKGLKLAESLLNNPSSTPRFAEGHKEINIFSVASGKLYERMLKIMILSVMRHTRHRVKFWFIEQFLSPSFKWLIPRMSEEYGFDFQMVTYKWPHWLRRQKEKQREIWGYKILFLDVLFPLSLEKIIFVDADQVVRTDLIDLVNMDLKGAPYGFTPMCDSRTEMEGFRFWKQGYWANYLRGRPYYISALYVVDLRRFRELAAGDRLRQQYHTLSADPASLSNLDQDLPNHMQFQIPIFSLPQDWLWCETWCSDQSLASAKTIDLCNNPQTKEPKLDRARRQVPEWTIYDNEIASLESRYRQKQPENELRSGGSRAAIEEFNFISKTFVEKGNERTEGQNTKSRNWNDMAEQATHMMDEL